MGRNRCRDSWLSLVCLHCSTAHGLLRGLTEIPGPRGLAGPAGPRGLAAPAGPRGQRGLPGPPGVSLELSSSNMTAIMDYIRGKMELVKKILHIYYACFNYNWLFLQKTIWLDQQVHQGSEGSRDILDQQDRKVHIACPYDVHVRVSKASKPSYL